MAHWNSLYFIRRSESALRQLHPIGPFVAATLACVRHRCGNPRCHCATSQGHPSWRLTYKGPGQKTVTVYVPVALLAEVRRWVENYRAFKKLAAIISSAQIGRVRVHVRERRRRR